MHTCYGNHNFYRSRSNCNITTTDSENKQVIFKKCTPFTGCISETNNKQLDNAKNLDVVVSMYKLIEYNYNYSKSPRRFYHFYRDGPKNPVTNSE